MGNFNNINNSGEEGDINDPNAFENSVEFLALEKEMRELVRKSGEEDKNLTEKEILRRDTIFRMLHPRDDDAN